MRNAPLLILAALAAVASPSAAAHEGRLSPAGVVVRTYDAESGHGLSHFNRISAQDDGALWLTSFDGAARFDGVRFDVFRGSTVPELPSNRVLDAHATPAGDAVLTTDRGDIVTVRGQDGAVRVWPHGSVLGTGEATLQWFEGELWALGRGIARFVDGEPVQVAAHGEVVRALARFDGEILVASNGLFALDGDRLRARRHDPPGEVFAFAEHGDRLYVLGDGSLVVLRAGAAPQVLAMQCPGIAHARFVQALMDRSGTLRVWSDVPRSWWEVVGDQLVCEPAAPLATSGGGALDRDGRLWRVHDGALWRDAERVRELEWLGAVLTIDPHDTIWVANIAGDELLAARVAAFEPLTESRSAALHVAADPGGGWVVRRDEPFATRVDEDGAVVGRVYPLFPGDEAHRIVYQPVSVDERWAVPSTTGICLIERIPGDLHCRPVIEPPALRWHDVTLATTPGSIWAQSTAGVHRWDLAAQRWFPVVQDLDGASGPLLALPDGRVVIGREDQLFVATVDGDVETVARSERHPGRPLRALAYDGNDVWLATAGSGLCRWRPDTQRVDGCVSVTEGLAHDSLVGVTGTERWLLASSTQGVFALLRDDVSAVLTGQRARLSPLVLDDAHGLNGRASYGPSLDVDSRGRLWVPSVGGAMTLDLSLLPQDTPSAPRLRSVTTGGQRVVFEDRVELDASGAPTRIRWRSDVGPWADQLVFRYRLDEDAWTYSPDREVTFPRLPPGGSRFEVQAGLGGLWSPALTVDIQRAPRFRETPWAPASGALALIAMMTGVGRARRRTLERQRAALARLVEERTADLARHNAWLEEASEALTARNAEVRRQAERLEELDRARTRFIANVGHELRTPLTLVLGALTTIEEEPHDARRWAPMARSNASRLAELVEQLMDIARLDADALPVHLQHDDLVDAVGLIVDRLEVAGEARGVEILMTAPPTLDAWVDPDLLDKVVGNLIHNAVKYAPDGTSVDVVLHPPEPEMIDPVASIEVLDRGPGVPVALRERLFERFYQVDSGDDRAHGGVGIGLALAREVADVLGGALRFEPRDGGGSRFVFELPVAADSLPTSSTRTEGDPPSSDGPSPVDMEATSPSSRPAAVARRPSVVVAEDNHELREYLADRLGRDFDVHEAADGLEALEQVRRARPDVVLADIMMPRMDGVAFCHALRSEAALASTPVLLLTAKTLVEDRLEGLSVADDYMTKPFDVREVAQRLRNLIRLSSSNTATRAQGAEQAQDAADADFENRLHTFVVRNASNTELGVVMLANVMGLSERHFRREVRRITGKSPNAFVRDVRLQIADDALRTARVRSVAEAAESVGWTQSYFSRLYQQHHGVPPSTVLRRG